MSTSTTTTTDAAKPARRAAAASAASAGHDGDAGRGRARQGADRRAAASRPSASASACAPRAARARATRSSSPTSQRAEDEVVETHGVKVLIDPKSLAVPDGTELDFEDEKLNGLQVQEPEREGPLRLRRILPRLNVDASWITSRGWDCRRALDLRRRASLDRALLRARQRAVASRPLRRASPRRASARRGARPKRAALNEAYRTLKDPLTRAVYLVELNGVELPARRQDDRRSASFLMESHGAREELHEASSVATRSMRSAAERARRHADRRSPSGLGDLLLGTTTSRADQTGARFACATSTSSPRRRGRVAATWNGERMTLLEIPEPGETPAAACRRGHAGGRHRSRHHQLAGRDRARRQARGAARRDRQGAGAVGRALPATGGVLVGDEARAADGAASRSNVVVGEALHGPRRRRPRRPSPACCPTSSAGQRRDRHGAAARSRGKARHRRSRSRPRSCGRCASAPRRRWTKPVERAVITVPAYFDDAQRQATKDAARARRPRSAAPAQRADRGGDRLRPRQGLRGHLRGLRPGRRHLRHLDPAAGEGRVRGDGDRRRLGARRRRLRSRDRRAHAGASARRRPGAAVDEARGEAALALARAA